LASKIPATMPLKEPQTYWRSKYLIRPFQKRKKALTVR
jgi:hypothetical protein